MGKTFSSKVSCLGIAAFVFSQEARSTLYEVMLAQNEQAKSYYGKEVMRSEKGVTSFMIDVPEEECFYIENSRYLRSASEKHAWSERIPQEIKAFLNVFVDTQYHFTIEKTIKDTVNQLEEMLFPRLLMDSQSEDEEIPNDFWAKEVVKGVLDAIHQQHQETIFQALYGSIASRGELWTSKIPEHGCTVQVRKADAMIDKN